MDPRRGLRGSRRAAKREQSARAARDRIVSHLLLTPQAAQPEQQVSRVTRKLAIEHEFASETKLGRSNRLLT